MAQGSMSHRTNIIETLKLISSLEEQLKYEKGVPIAHVPYELFCMWFDDFYHPSSPDFISSFNEKELSDLSEFNQFFDEIGKTVNTSKDVSNLQKDSNWIAIQSRAKKLLIKHGW